MVTPVHEKPVGSFTLRSIIVGGGGPKSMNATAGLTTLFEDPSMHS